MTARLARARVRKELVPARGQRPQPGRPCRMPPHAPPPPRGLREGRPAGLRTRPRSPTSRCLAGVTVTPPGPEPAPARCHLPSPPAVPRRPRGSHERGQLQRGGSLDSPGACSVRGGTAVTGRPAVALEAEAEATLPRPQGQWEPGRGQGGGTGGEGCHRQARPGGRGRSSAGDGDGDGASRITIALPHVTASPLRGPTATTHPAGPLGLQAPPAPTPRCR